MCGIAGIFSSAVRPLHAIGPMTAAQIHRGPDGEGYLLADGAELHLHRSPTMLSQNPLGFLALGHRRLAIQDTSDAGLQPMPSGDQRFWITYNGEIYNFIELRRELAAEGVEFRTGTDTEVVVEAYRQWGFACFKRFNGMWALAIWDTEQDSIILSRDRFGIKPLHYVFREGALYFASEIKGLLAIEGMPRQLNRSAAADFLRWGVVNHSNETFFKDVLCFPPAHFAIVPRQSPEQWRLDRYWTPPDKSHLAISPISDADAESEFRSLFRSSVSLRLRSDVPIGFCLSGGLDSSSIVCAAKGSLPPDHPLETFTSASAEPQFDERRWSDLVAARSNAISHHVFPEAVQLAQTLPSVVQAQEEPFGGASVYAQYLLMECAHNSNVPVLLDGQGADEVLCGYRKYIFFSLHEQILAGRLIDVLSGVAWWAAHGDKGLIRLAEGTRYLPRWLRGGRTEPLADAVCTPFTRDWEASRLVSAQTPTSSYRQLDDLERYSVPALLRYEDRNSMAWGIESRVPFLDYRLVDFMLKLPTRHKVRRSQTKSILRRALRGLVPNEILDRRDKLGFVTPQYQWMHGPLRSTINTALTGTDYRLGFLVDGRAVSALFDVQGYWATAALDAVFRVYMLDSWARTFDVEI